MLPKPPNHAIEMPLHDDKVMVWCGISNIQMYDPWFSDGNFNADTYLPVMRDFFWKTHSRIKDYKKYFFIKDGVWPHIANIVQNFDLF